MIEKIVGKFALPTYGNRHGLVRCIAPRHYGDKPDGTSDFEVRATFNPSHSGRGDALNFSVNPGFSKDWVTIAPRAEFGTAKSIFEPAPETAPAPATTLVFDEYGNDQFSGE